MSSPTTSRPASAGRWARRFILLAAWATVAPLRADSLATRLEGVLARSGDRSDVGVCVLEVGTGRTVFARNAGASLKPASVLKLLTTAAALDRFGAGFEFETSAYLSGDELWVVGSGDPSLGDERMAAALGRPRGFPFEEWAAELHALGVRSLSKITLDDSIFDREYRHPDWPANQADRWYQAPVGGLNYNTNCLDARASLAGGRVMLETFPPLPAEFLENRLRGGQRSTASGSRALQSDLFSFRGTVAGTTRFDPLAVGRPTVFFGFALRMSLEARGVAVRGEVTRRPLLPAELAGAQLVARQATPLPPILWRCNTFSQNLYSECLLKALAAYDEHGRPTGRTGGWESGARMALSQMERLGLNTTGLVVRDGSGLSHENRATAAFFASLLVRMAQHPDARIYRESLAAAGEDGSMRRRYGEALFRGRFRGKTGSIQGVTTLAGYLTRSDGRELAFAVLVNGSDTGLPERICRALLD